MKNSSIQGILRTMVLVVVLTAAVGSLIWMFNAGRNQKSIFLIILFTCWVLSPFVALVVSIVISIIWTNPGRKALYLLALFISLGSLIAYGVDWTGTKTAFKYLVVPLVSWLIMLIIVPIIRSIFRKKHKLN